MQVEFFVSNDFHSYILFQNIFNQKLLESGEPVTIIATPTLTSWLVQSLTWMTFQIKLINADL